MVNNRAKLRYKWKKKLGFDRNVMVIRKRPLSFASAAGRRRHKQGSAPSHTLGGRSLPALELLTIVSKAGSDLLKKGRLCEPPQQIFYYLFSL